MAIAYASKNRLPGGDANPYLTYAAMLAAGLDGIERGIELGGIPRQRL